MTSTDQIAQAYHRTRRAFDRRPSLGKGTAHTAVTLRDGLRCEVSEGTWSLTLDMPGKAGGSDAGPSPGVFGRAALGGCLAICYAQAAAVHDLPIEELTVEIEADYDARGEYGFREVDQVYSEFRYHVRVTSPAPPAEVERIFDEGEANSSILQAFRLPHRVVRALDVRQTERST